MTVKSSLKASVAFAFLTALVAAVPFGVFGIILGAAYIYKGIAEETAFLIAGIFTIILAPIAFFAVATAFSMIPGSLAALFFLLATLGVRNVPYRHILLLIMSVFCGYAGGELTLAALGQNFRGPGLVLMVHVIGPFASLTAATLILYVRRFSSIYSPFIS